MPRILQSMAVAVKNSGRDCLDTYHFSVEMFGSGFIAYVVDQPVIQ